MGRIQIGGFCSEDPMQGQDAGAVVFFEGFLQELLNGTHFGGIKQANV